MKLASPKASEARRIILSASSSALGVLMAVKELLGDCWHWEPESVWLALEQLNADPPVENRTRLQAGIALMFVPSFYWDGIVFEKTALSLDGHEPNPEALEEPDVGQLAWAVEEAAKIVEWHGDPAWIFMHEPTAYAAVVMHRDGYVLAPGTLAFAQASLDAMNDKAASALKAEAEKAWTALDKDLTTLATSAYPETPAGVQLARLATVELHCHNRRRQQAADLAALKA